MALTIFVAMIAVAAAAIAGVVYGIAAARKKWFPYRLFSRWNARVAGTTRHTRPRAEQFGHLRDYVDVVMVGDSLTEGCLWNEFFPGVSLANRGVGGDTTAKIRERLDDITAKRARKAFILAGVNDLSAKFGRTVEQTFADYRAIVAALRAAGSEVVIQSAVQPSRDCEGGDEWADKVIQLNNKLRSYAAAEGLTYIDLDSLLCDERGLRPEFTYDGIHLSAPAYVVWTGAVRPHLS